MCEVEAERVTEEDIWNALQKMRDAIERAKNPTIKVGEFDRHSRRFWVRVTTNWGERSINMGSEHYHRRWRLLSACPQEDEERDVDKSRLEPYAELRKILTSFPFRYDF